MKVIVKDFLNVRVGKPSVNAPCYQYLAPGSELEVDGKLYPGDKYEDIDLWFKGEGGNYYWSGGVNHSVVPPDNSSDFWFDHFEMKSIHAIESGERSNVLILDSGINTYQRALKDVIIASENFVPNSTTIESIDAVCHGTHCAGLIAARPTDYQVGASPNSRLYVGKVTENGDLDNADTLTNALTEFLNNTDFDVISISQCLLDPDDALEKIIKKHIDKKRIIVAAIGNDGQHKNLNKKRYPGFYDHVISVGACEDDGSLSNYTCFPAKADIFCYGTDIKSYKKDSFPEPLTGTSQSTAIVAGVTALVISFLKKKNIDYNQDSIRNLLKKYSNPLKNNSSYRLINPKLIFETLLKFTSDESKTLQDYIDADVAVS